MVEDSGTFKNSARCEFHLALLHWCVVLLVRVKLFSEQLSHSVKMPIFEKHANMKFCFKLGRTPTETHAMLERVYAMML